jgi:CDP-diacylglycerol---glycerol-3-phosphate 3-phosphatidyltransferase
MLPLYLTLVRLIIAPVIMPLFIFIGMPWNSRVLDGFLAFLFAGFAFTDFLDGYIARYYGQETDWGRLLDPLADKFLVFSTLIALSAIGKLFFYWTIIIVAREFFVTGLREIALSKGITIPVMFIGKIKTCMQCIFITWCIWNSHSTITGILLAVTLLITVWSGYSYYQVFRKQLYNF